jgi:hypothetical protein
LLLLKQKKIILRVYHFGAAGTAGTRCSVSQETKKERKEKLPNQSGA